MSLNNSYLNKITEISIFIFPPMFILVPKGGDVVLLFLLVINLTYLTVNRSNKISYSLEEKILLSVIGLYLGLHLLNNFFVGSKALETDGIALFIILLPLFHHVRKFSMDRNVVIYGILAGAFACFLIAIYQKYMLGMPRVSGFFKIIAFGSISITLALMCLWMAILTRRRKISLLMFCGFGFAFYASLLSGSRGPWLAVISCLVLLIIFNPRAWTVKKRAVITLSSLVLISSAYALPGVQQRVDLAISQFDAYFSQGVVASNSVGLRLEVWRAVLISVGENSWSGIGSENFGEMIADLANRNKIDPILTTKISHAHNEYLSVAMYRGLPGLASLLLIFLVPFCTFLKYYHTVKSNDQLLLGCGIILIVSSMTMSMSDLFFQHHRESLFFAVYIYLIYGLVFSGSEKARPGKALP